MKIGNAVGGIPREDQAADAVVVLLELYHIAEHNHSEQFYRLMSQVMPGWEKTKERLDGMANRLLT
ncbi:YgjP-like metallopeptidase domain-containing protein [Aeromonas allosaccharophila]|uniref:YgjP-like metallopeptidase domain-containing protein n=1 Tax=Aeromonas allosaccharophila TaxID=656 RepID=A0ABZ0FF54_9GAMM|nr:YgjP-like metallopeptidase domain-containing protein [Aeromonas allosaccharophila]WOE68090.1 YgjP-like metallopeptidase domain-containing protein [Aeromonas allosaccharophila]